MISLGRKVRDAVDNPAFNRYVLRPGYKLIQNLTDSESQTGYKPEKTDEDTVDVALDWITEQQSRQSPFFAWIHLMDAHDPYARWENHLEAIRGDTDIPHVINGEPHVEPGSEPPQALIDAYDTGIRSADEQIGRVLEELDADTTVVVTGDHGEEFGRFNDFHAASLHSTMTRVPLIIRSPPLGKGRVTNHWAQHLDVPPTLTSIAEIDSPTEWEGDDLSTIEGSRSLDDPVRFTVKEETIGVKKDGWKLIKQSGGTSKLYRSPHGEHDSGPVDRPEIAEELKSEVDSLRRYINQHTVGKTGRSLLTADEEISDDVQENLEDLGYL